MADSAAGVFDMVREEAAKLANEGAPPQPEPLRRLDRRARVVLGLFATRDEITAADVASALGLAARTARGLLQEWVGEGWVRISNASRKARAYALSADYRQFIGGVSAPEKP